MIESLPAPLLADIQQDWIYQDYSRALGRMKKYWSAAPKAPERCLYYATILGHCSRFQEAQQLLDELVHSVNPERRLWALGSAAVASCDFLRFDWTAKYMQQAASEPNPPAAVFQHWAEALERLNHLSEAEEVLADGQSHFSNHPGLALLEARLARRSGLGEKAERLARKVIGMAETSPDIRCHALYELGHALDMQDRCAEAYGAFVAAKEIQKPQAAVFENTWRAHIQQMRAGENFPTKEEFRHWAQAPASPSPRHAFLVGCPRSGTTLLERMLGSHPLLASSSESTIWHSEVWMPLLREHAGATDIGTMLSALTEGQIEAARDRYWRFIPQTIDGPLGDRFLLDKNPSIFPVLAGAVRLFPQANLLVALRDPRDIVWSCFTQPLPINPATSAFISLQSTAEQVAVELLQWFQLRERLTSPWLEVRYETLVQDTEPQMQRVLSFLGLKWSPEVLAFHERGDPVRSPTYATASRPVHQDAVGRWKRYAEVIAPLETELGEVLKTLRMS